MPKERDTQSGSSKCRKTIRKPFRVAKKTTIAIAKGLAVEGKQMMALHLDLFRDCFSKLETADASQCSLEVMPCIPLKNMQAAKHWCKVSDYFCFKAIVFANGDEEHFCISSPCFPPRLKQVSVRALGGIKEKQEFLMRNCFHDLTQKHLTEESKGVSSHFSMKKQEPMHMERMRYKHYWSETKAGSDGKPVYVFLGQVSYSTDLKLAETEWEYFRVSTHSWPPVFKEASVQTCSRHQKSRPDGGAAGEGGAASKEQPV